MKLLVDANLSPVDRIVRDWSALSDRLGRQRLATILALTGRGRPSLVLFRSADALTPREQAALLAANLPTVEDVLRVGAVVSISLNHLRVRRLPLRS